MKTDLIKCKDKYDDLFTSVIYLLENGSLITSTEIREFIEIMESAHSKANSAIRKAIRKSDMPLSKKAQLKRLHKES